ncbi:MAG TPA: sigma-70 family RNA polymerase sigma factor [Candidatus Acidoferrales bacterium]|nr:sigma-70 family RNA polymerase sigma factor [Candidatus Acidoferrales bacterium]
MAESLYGRVNAAMRAAEWSEAAFEQFFREHYGRVAAILCRLVGEQARAEELASDIFWKLYRGRLLPPGENAASWLYRTATNAGIDALRADARRRRYERAAGEEQASGSSPADPLGTALGKEERAQVRAALALLKPAQAQALILRASGFSYKDVAETLGVKATSVGTMLIRAETAFRACYRAVREKEEER